VSGPGSWAGSGQPRRPQRASATPARGWLPAPTRSAASPTRPWASETEAHETHVVVTQTGRGRRKVSRRSGSLVTLSKPEPRGQPSVKC